MDIVTHAFMGLAIAGPLLPVAPLTATCFIAGSVLPDLDAFSRVFGRRAFLRWHQTYAHSIPVIGAIGMFAMLAIPASLGEPWAGAALAAGMLLHAGLDVTNTFGTAILSPFSSRRFCTEWVFFIDATVIAATAAALLVQWLAFDFWQRGAAAVAGAYVLVLVAYWMLRAALHRRAMRRTPAGTVSLIPSALAPWRYFGCAALAEVIDVFRMNAITGAVDRRQSHRVLDAAWAGVLSAIPEFAIMRELSPTYHAIEAKPDREGTRLMCVDLRVRNFGGHFGELTITVDPAGGIIRTHLNV